MPWNRLPRVRRTAPEAYDALVSHRSWTKLLLRFVFDPGISLWSRVVRADRGGMPVVMPAAPAVPVSEPATAGA